MKKSTFAVLLASVLGLLPVAPAFADNAPKVKVCPFGLPPLPPKGLCAEELIPPPPANKCEQYIKTKINDGKPLSEEEFNYFIRGGTFHLSLCEPLLSAEQRKKLEKARREAKELIEVEFDDKP